MKKIYLLSTLAIIQFLFVGNLQAQVWDSLSSGMGPVGSSGSINASITAYGNNIYAGGEFTTAGGVTASNIAQWDGTAWSALGTGLPDFVASVTMFNGQLFAGGDFLTQGADTVNHIAKWSANSWHAVTGGVRSSQAAFTTISAMMVHDSTLYVGGSFDTAGYIATKNLARWDGLFWTSIGNVTGANSTINAMTTYQGNLVIAGLFDHVGSVAVNNIAMWDGTTWTAIGTGSDGMIYSVVGDGSNLYIGGSFSNVGGASHPYLAKWNGTSWGGVGSGNPNQTVFTMIASSGSLFVGGGFDSIAGQPFVSVAQWNGSSWSALGSGLGNGTGFQTAASMLVVNDNLYVGGRFFVQSGAPGNCIASWRITAGINEVVDNNEVSIYPNPGNGVMNITLKNPAEKPVFDMYNLLGEKIYHTNLNPDKTTINTGSNAAGVYLYRISTADGTLISSGKYVAQ